MYNKKLKYFYIEHNSLNAVSIPYINFTSHLYILFNVSIYA